MDYIRNFVKKQMSSLAKWLDSVTNGRISPNQITVASLLLHIPIFFAIIGQQYVLAAVMLVIFGLMDSLDGALARAQGVDSRAGMLLDASFDRMKESIVFIALIYRFALDNDPRAVLAAAFAITGSLAVSYVKAKGETAVKGSRLSVADTNRIFQSGLMRYEIRMTALVFGLIFSSLLIPVIWFIAVLSWATAFYRLLSITRQLKK